MVPFISDIAFLLAHGADPTPLDWDEALANLQFTLEDLQWILLTSCLLQQLVLNQT